MSSTDKPELDVDLILFPYIKSLFITSTQQQWFKSYCELFLKTYISDLVDTKLFAQQNIYNINVQITHLRCFFAYLNKDVESLPDNLFVLLNGMDNIRSVSKAFENAVFANVFNRRNGFNLDDFYTDNYISTLKKLLHKLLLLHVYQKIDAALSLNPSDQFLIEHKKWIVDKILADALVADLSPIQSEKSHHDPKYLWYFFNGANRLPLFFQLEWYAFKEMIKRYRTWVEYLADSNSDLQKAMFTFPLTAIMFLLNILFLALLPYRFLKTVVNETYDEIISPIHNFIIKFKPNYKNSKTSYVSLLLLKAGIYGTLLTLMSLPLLPIPLVWLPTALISPYILILPLCYLTIIPVLAITVNVYRQESNYTNKMVAPALNRTSNQDCLIQEQEDCVNNKSQALLFRYSNTNSISHSEHQDAAITLKDEQGSSLLSRYSKI